MAGIEEAETVGMIKSYFLCVHQRRIYAFQEEIHITVHILYDMLNGVVYKGRLQNRRRNGWNFGSAIRNKAIFKTKIAKIA